MRTAYFGFEVSDLDAWENYLALLGVGIERTGDGLFCRMDEKARRLHFVEGSADDIAWLGWEVDGSEAFDALRAHLSSLGHAPQDGAAVEAKLRGVDRFFHFLAPHGVRYEIALGVRAADQPFVSDKLEGGFVTRDLGIGHVAFNSTDHKGDEKFLREALSAHLSDYIYQPMPDGSTMHASFLHTNPRHHSVAFAEGLGLDSKLNHFHLEMAKMVDLGKTYERLKAAGVAIAVTLGQHTNDRNVTFYAQTPSKFMLEIGYGGITIEDEDSWEPVIHDRISEWGHEFQAA